MASPDLRFTQPGLSIAKIIHQFLTEKWVKSALLTNLNQKFKLSSPSDFKKVDRDICLQNPHR
ncbi:MAG: hypothetical protein D6728_07240 [Cyanobacteria bacterium J055]|nr:MAG: hypothetical protein D6728_07240 [Cyanobacteria bacterium J055]